MKSEFSLIHFKAQKGLLKNCPFCGSSNKIIIIYKKDKKKHYLDGNFWYNFVYAHAECPDCFAKSPYVTSSVFCNESISETLLVNEVIKLWNKRPELAEVNNEDNLNKNDLEEIFTTPVAFLSFVKKLRELRESATDDIKLYFANKEPFETLEQETEIKSLTLEEFDTWLDKQEFKCDKLVYLRMRYDYEKEWTYQHELLLVDTDCPNYYCWENDWHEGQEHIEILGCIDISDIDVPLFEEVRL